MAQFSAVQEVAEVCRPRGVSVIADGGIRYSGDIVKAIAGGADTTMIGSLFAGTEERPGETVLYEGRTFKVVRGRGYINAMQKDSKTRSIHFDDEQRKHGPEGGRGQSSRRQRLDPRPAVTRCAP